MNKLFLILCLWASIGYAEDYTFGVVPQYSVENLNQQWNPFLKNLGNRTNNNFIFKPVESMDEFEQLLNLGYYDFVYVNPFQYTRIKQKEGYKAFAKVKDMALRGIIVVNNNSNIKNISQLSGSEIAFSNKRAFAAYYLSTTELHKKNIKFTPKFLGSHEKVYDAVSKGLYVAGGGVEQTLEAAPYDIKNKLSILYTSPDSPPHAFAKHPRISETVVADIVSAMTNMNNNKSDELFLNMLNFPSGFVPATDSDWNSIRKINVD